MTIVDTPVIPSSRAAQNAQAQHLNWGQRQIVAAVARSGSTNRLSLADELGLSPQTMSRATRSLVADELLDEEPVHSGTRGQPARNLSYRKASLASLGLSLSDTRIALTLEDLDGTVLFEEEATGGFGHPDDALARATTMIDSNFERIAAHTRLVGMGVAAKGFFVQPGRSVVSREMPAAWAGINLRTVFEQRYELDVTVCNNARAVAMGSIRALGPNAVRNALFVYIGNGIGGALVVDGRLAEGAYGNAGEIGALIPDGDYRPSRGRITALLGKPDFADWQGLGALSQEDRTQLLDWCRRAGAELQPAMQAATYLIDVDTVFVCARFPRDIARQMVAGIDLLPHGTMLLSGRAADKLLRPPRIEVLESVAMESGACALAMSRYLAGGAGLDQLSSKYV
ncbi:Sugar kinase of the NBD/HSP70 family, may contain an N-terminal HTH domain [Devosia crocina]|uniref:Sugar kinase of the NBD/HSP70 family, may contain an N-terminal HTH domain n=1 Tax=Devosia crocina TaxID=429728 RepID=A0A1I7NVR9_9HYPH|nr:ROK family transcriptional regulator [Devosia crocina]SFV38673.1 Sugar kinase of the NBD/HSP70 family, may contain an N-terminal HTH domain [Devosia crocina]